MSKIPLPVTSWLYSHKGQRKPVYVPGQFESYAKSKTSACWGQPLGGMEVGDGYKIAVCQPSPQRVGVIPVMFYDFVKI